MVRFKLAARACARLREIVRSSPKARELKRAQALLWIHDGQSAQRVAQQLGVSVRSIRRWIRTYRERVELKVAERIREGRHSGRPAKQLKLARRVIERVWDRDPRRYGFRALVWTVPMLRCLIYQRSDKWLGHATIRRALRSLHQRYKRPRLALARRSSPYVSQSMVLGCRHNLRDASGCGRARPGAYSRVLSDGDVCAGNATFGAVGHLHGRRAPSARNGV